MSEPKVYEALEMAMCADCNMDNLAKWNPEITSNPMFALVKAQIRCTIDLLEGGEGALILEVQP